MFGMFKAFAGKLSEVSPELGGKLAAFIPQEKPPPPDKDAPCPRWEKAMMAVKGIAQQVAKIDKDGIEVLVVGDGVETYQGVRDVNGLMRICEAVEPEGGLALCPALGQALEQATERLYGEEGANQKEQAILVVLSRKPDDADDLVAAVQAVAAKIKQDSDLTITFVHVGNDAEAEEFLSFIDDNLKVTSEETGEQIDIIDTLKDEDIKKAFAESQEPGFMASGGTGALIGAFAGAACGAGGYYAYQQHCINKRTKGFNGGWYVIGTDGQKTRLRLKIKDDMEGNLTIQGYPDEEPDDFGDDPEDELEWDGKQDCPCCQGRGYFDKWCRPCDESAMHKDLDCPVCGGEGSVEGEMTACRRCKGKGGIDIWGKPCMKNAMHFEKDCPKCEGRCFFPAEAGEEPEWDEEDEEPPPPWGRSTAKARYQGENCWRYTADEEEVIPGSIEDESTVVWEDGTRWEEKKEKVSYGKMAIAGLGGAALGGAAGYLIQKKFFNKASKKTPGDYIIILDRSAAMAEMDS